MSVLKRAIVVKTSVPNKIPEFKRRFDFYNVATIHESDTELPNDTVVNK